MRCRACAICTTSAGAGACPRCRERDRRRATHRRAVARCQKSADSGSHRRSRSLRLLCHPGEFHSGSTTGTGCVKFFFDSHWPARRVGLDGMEHQALLNVAQGKGVKIAMEGPINPPPVAGGAGRELPAYLSNGVVGLKPRQSASESASSWLIVEVETLVRG